MCTICESIRNSETELAEVLESKDLNPDEIIEQEIYLLERLNGLYAEREVLFHREDWCLTHPWF